MRSLMTMDEVVTKQEMPGGVRGRDSWLLETLFFLKKKTEAPRDKIP